MVYLQITQVLLFIYISINTLFEAGGIGKNYLSIGFIVSLLSLIGLLISPKRKEIYQALYPIAVDLGIGLLGGLLIQNIPEVYVFALVGISIVLFRLKIKDSFIKRNILFTLVLSVCFSLSFFGWRAYDITWIISHIILFTILVIFLFSIYRFEKNKELTFYSGAAVLFSFILYLAPFIYFVSQKTLSLSTIGLFKDFFIILPPLLAWAFFKDFKGLTERLSTKRPVVAVFVFSVLPIGGYIFVTLLEAVAGLSA